MINKIKAEIEFEENECRLATGSPSRLNTLKECLKWAEETRDKLWKEGEIR